jgi:anti-anti-sigma factor
MEAYLAIHNTTAEILLAGDLDDGSVPLLRSVLDQARAASTDRIVLKMQGVRAISAAGIRCLISAHQAMPEHVEMIFLGVGSDASEKLRLAGITQHVGAEPQRAFR